MTTISQLVDMLQALQIKHGDQPVELQVGGYLGNARTGAAYIEALFNQAHGRVQLSAIEGDDDDDQ